MPARQKPTLVEIMIMVAILGILASIVLPALEQAKRRAQSAGRQATQGGHAALDPSAADGQLNTIEVSELSQNEQQPRPEQYVGVFTNLIPIIISVLVVWFMLTRFRQQMSRRA
jgi:type II secretory pathway pseudopilin PulG